MVIPQVFAAKTVDSTPGFLIQEFLISRSSNVYDDERLGRGLATVHQYTNDQFGFPDNNYCGATIQNNEWSFIWAEFF